MGPSVSANPLRCPPAPAPVREQPPEAGLRRELGYLVTYRTRSACAGSASSGGLTVLPHSQTLSSDAVMLVVIWGAS